MATISIHINYLPLLPNGKVNVTVDNFHPKTFGEEEFIKLMELVNRFANEAKEIRLPEFEPRSRFDSPAYGESPQLKE